MPYDPTKPANGAPIISAELRDQFAGLNDLIDAVPTSQPMTDRLDAHTAGNCEFVSLPALTVSNPPTQAEVQAMANLLNNLYVALTRT
ncbi:MAG: hypothetical protein RL616_2533 [Verrucomicrobiota bacterium]|jgi:hypothetical protein